MLGPFSDYARPYRRRIALGVAAIALAQAAAARIPLLLGRAVDSLDPASSLPPETDPLGAVAGYAVGILILAAVVAVGGYAMRRLLGNASTGVEYDIRTAYFAHLLRMPLSFFQRHHTGDLMSRATNDLNSVRIFFTYGIRGIVETSLIFCFSIAMMCSIDWQLALLVLIPLPLLSLLIIRMAALVQTRFKAIQEQFGRISNFVQENLSGIRVVKAYALTPVQTRAFDELNGDYLAMNHYLIRARAVYRPLSYLIASMGLGLNLWLGGKAVIAGQLGMGDFVAFNAYLTLLIRPIAYMGWVIDRFQRALVAMRRIDEIMDIEPDIADFEDPGQRRRRGGRRIAGRIDFRDLSFTYDGPPVLSHIDLRIPAGSTLGLIGRVGSGKTTLARLIPRLIEAGEGDLLIDGIPVRQWPLGELREAIGYVSQTPFLFSKTVAANVAYGVEEAGAEDMRDAAEGAQLAAEVEGFAQGFETLVGERGVTLSGGQKQRATLARAIMRQPRILILDDALSAVDTHTEEAILRYLRGATTDCTTIIIAHRISTLRAADQIVVLDEGRIAEWGDHDTLVSRGGLYAEIDERQRLAAELEAL